MRLWSLHPKYLDTQGLVAVWREGLLAKKVLERKTKGYTKHPQLIRFKKHPFPLKAVDHYLIYIFYESENRGFHFRRSKVEKAQDKINTITVTSGQIEYEFNHLKKKLSQRNPILYKNLLMTKNIDTHPLFEVIKGNVETWEKI